jgi:hypothetical protein
MVLSVGTITTDRADGLSDAVTVSGSENRTKKVSLLRADPSTGFIKHEATK